MGVLGLSLVQLSSDHGDQTLEALIGRGVIRGLPRRFATEPPRIAARSTTARAALGYLHANDGVEDVKRIGFHQDDLRRFDRHSVPTPMAMPMFMGVF